MKSMIKQKPWIRDYLLIFIGTALMSIALKSAFDTNGIVDGGFSGIAIIVKSVTEPLLPGGIPLGVTNLLLNIPMFFLGIKIMGFGFMAKTIWGTVSLSFWLTVIPVIPLVEGDMVLAVLIGGVIQGTGIGLVFLGRGTTGGTDLVASLIHRYVKHISIARIMQVIDGMIVVIGAFVFGTDQSNVCHRGNLYRGKSNRRSSGRTELCESSIYYYGSSGSGIEKNSRRSGPWGDRRPCTGYVCRYRTADAFFRCR